MKINNKGITIIEIISSLILMSIVLVLIVNLFLNVRRNYNKSKDSIDYEVANSTITKYVASDINSYGIKSIEVTSTNEITITFNKFRETQLSKNITKKLMVEEKDGIYSLSYKNVIDVTGEGMETEEERLATLIKVDLPKESKRPTISVIENNGYKKITVTIRDSKDNKYDTHIYGKIKY